MATTIMTSAVVAAYQVEVAVQLLVFGESNLKPGNKLYLPITQPIGFLTVEFNLDPECPDHSSIPIPDERATVPVQLERTPKNVAQELEMENWRLELPFDFLSKFVCSNCGSVESVRKPVKEVKQGKTKCPQCGNINREAVKYFRITAESEDADLSFRDFGLCEKELIQIVSENKRLCLQAIDD